MATELIHHGKGPELLETFYTHRRSLSMNSCGDKAFGRQNPTDPRDRRNKYMEKYQIEKHQNCSKVGLFSWFWCQRHVDGWKSSTNGHWPPSVLIQGSVSIYGRFTLPFSVDLLTLKTMKKSSHDLHGAKMLPQLAFWRDIGEQRASVLYYQFGSVQKCNGRFSESCISFHPGDFDGGRLPSSKHS